MRFSLTFLLLLIMLSSRGQITQTERIELPFKYSDENYLITIAGRQGIILFREAKEKNRKKEAWEILVLDTSLEEKLNIIADVDYKYSIIGYEYRDGYFYILFNMGNSGKKNYYLMKISIEDGSIARFEIENELTMEASHLLINNKTVVLGGYINYRSTFVVFDYINDKVQVVPGFFNARSEVLDFNYDKNHDSFNVLLGQKNALNHNEIVIRSFDSKGKVHVDEKFELDKNWRALNGRLIISDNNQIIVSGSFGASSSYYSQGYYFANLTPGKELLMKYIGFTDTRHFFDYMKPDRAEKIKSKIDKTKNSNKPYEFKTQAYVHGIKESAGEYILVSELYKPEFKGGGSLVAMGYEDNSNSGYRSQTGQKYVDRSSKLTNTDGASHISYNETIVLGLDENGKLLWDHSQSLDDVETLALEQVAVVFKENQNGMLLHKNRDELVYKSFHTEKGMLSDTTLAINTFEEFDQIDSHQEHQGRVQHWYDNHFIVWGYQKISNNQSSQIDKKRNIFFINKLFIE